MTAKQILKTILLAVVLAASAAACAPAAPETYSDPFVYCQAVGTVDSPGETYQGPAITPEIIRGFIHAAGLENSSEPSEMFEKTTTWRCMDGQVYACNFGANLPCTSKANTDQAPTQAMQEFCASSPGSDFIPMSVTGHDTVFSWKCEAAEPVVSGQISEVDKRGFIANIWYPIEAETKP